MKELEKTRRISISAILFLLVVVISLLNFRKPEFIFMNSSKKTLEKVSKNEHVITLREFNEMDSLSYQLIDVRTIFEFSKGHLSQAKNIPTSQILEAIQIGEIQNTSANNELKILYANNPDQANAVWMLLYQLGFENTKLLSISTYYDDKEFHSTEVGIAQAQMNYVQKMKEASTQKIKKIPVKQIKPKKKKVVTKPKKKKKMPEGGC